MIPENAPKKLYHKPVMLREALEELAVVPKNGWIVDGTFGDGGHSSAIYHERIEKFASNKLLSIDWDLSGYEALSTHGSTEIPDLLKDSTEKSKWVLANENFANLKRILTEANTKTKYGMEMAAILLDLGISSRQLVQKQRGFSFTGKSKVDMRMNPEVYTIAAYDLLNLLPYTKMSAMFRNNVGMPGPIAAKLVREILAAREMKMFGHTDDVERLTNIAFKIVPIRTNSKGRIHPATLLFLALRIAVNTELQNLQEVLPEALFRLLKGGRMLIMTYHSGEEEVVNQFVSVNKVKAEIIVPSPREVRSNPRSRSAKLYVITK